MDHDDDIIDRVMESIDNDSMFQRRFSLTHIFLFTMTYYMTYSNLVLALATPDHWCHVPGRNTTNYTLGQWKQIHIPLSTCKMYNITSLQTDLNHTTEDEITCQFGYEYDQTWYISTVSSANDWVCDKELFITNIFSASSLGEVAGALVLGQLGDYIGRRPVFMIGIMMMMIGRILGIFVVGNYYAFMFFVALSSFPSITPALSTLTILMEVSRPEKRSQLAQVRNYGWSLGSVLVASVCWAYPEWRIFTAITTIPLVFYAFTYGSIIESPRWLAGRGRIDECIKELKKIAKANGRVLKADLIEKLRTSSVTPETVYGAMSMMSSWRLAKNTIALTFAFVIYILCYGIILLNTTNLGGNPFLQFVWQSAIEVPGYTLGKYSCDKIGRRFTGIISYALSIIMFIPVVLTIKDNDTVFLTNSFLILAKCFLSIIFYSQTLQTMEIYPTCLKQTGMSIVIVVSGLLYVLVPYIVYLGTAYDARYPYVIMMSLCLIASIMQLLLPETLNAKLPETLHDTRDFGRDQKWIGLPRCRNNLPRSKEEVNFLENQQ